MSNYATTIKQGPVTFDSWVNPMQAVFRFVSSKVYTIEEDSATKIKHDELPVSNFMSLDKIRQHMEASGYSTEEIESDIAGLSELPEYANSKNNQKSRSNN